MNNLPQEQFTKIITYLQNARLSETTMNKHMIAFEKNQDIANEFCYWIDNRTFQTESPINVEGFTATDIFNKVPYFDGLKVYATLYELRENPEYVKKQIDNGTLGY